MRAHIPFRTQRWRSVVFSAAALVAAGTAVLMHAAPQGPGDGPSARRGPGGLSGVAVFMALDRDGMPGLSAAEISGAAATLKALDRNGDGLVTGDELPALGRGGRGRGERGRGGRGGDGDGPRAASDDDLTETLMAFDRNGDGKLTRAEVPERFQGIFARADANKDGELTPAEIKQSAAAQAPPSSPARGRGDGVSRPEGREGRRGGPFGAVDPLMAAIDRDGDRRLSIDEVDDVPAALRRFDRNGDGMLTLDEIFTGFGRGRG